MKSLFRDVILCEMQGWMRTDLELAPDPRHPGGVRLRRRRPARLLSLGLVSAGFSAFALDLVWEHHLVAALQLGICLALLWLHVRAELDDWRFDGDSAVRRSFDLRRFRFDEVRLPARELLRVVVAKEGPRAWAWLETRAGERHALAAGKAQQVEAIAHAFDQAFALASAEPPSRALH